MQTTLSTCNFVALKNCTNLVFFNDIGKLSNPDKAVVWRDEQETIATVQGGCSRLHQSGLDMASSWFYTQKHTGGLSCQASPLALVMQILQIINHKLVTIQTQGCLGALMIQDPVGFLETRRRYC